MTTHPEALRLAAELDDGYPLTGDAISAAAELRRQHARIAELEAQLEAIGAGGVGPLIGQPQEMPDLTQLTERGAKAWAGVDLGAQESKGSPMTQDTNTASGAADLRKALVIAEAALADIGDADREPGDDLAWCEARAAQALPEVRAALASAPAQPAAQQGAAYAALPDLIHVDGEIWSAIIDWKHAKHGKDALRKANGLERVLSDQMHAFADATHTLRASRGQAPAAPKGDIDE